DALANGATAAGEAEYSPGTLALPAPWRSGYAAACKAVYTGSIPVGALPEPGAPGRRPVQLPRRAAQYCGVRRERFDRLAPGRDERLVELARLRRAGLHDAHLGVMDPGRHAGGQQLARRRQTPGLPGGRIGTVQLRLFHHQGPLRS